MIPREPIVAVVGATGMIGREILSVLAERAFPAADVRAVASRASAGERVACGDLELRVSALDDEVVRGVDVVFLAAGPEVSAAHAPRLAQAGATVLDLSTCCLDDAAIPVVVPEVNLRVALGGDGATCRRVVVGTGVMAALAVALKPLDDAAGVSALTVATYESVSGLGSRGVAGLGSEAVRLLNAQPSESEVYPRQIAFNCIPVIGDLDVEGHSVHERGLADGLRRVLANPGLRVAATAVRVPTFYGLGAAVMLETERPVRRDAARAVLRTAPGVLLSEADDYVTPFETVGTDAVHVSRLRELSGGARALGFWLAVDSVHAAAVHAVAIAEFLLASAH